MKCPHCASSNIYQRHQKTHLDYNEYRCRDCGRQFNERTGTVYNFLTHRTEVIVLAVLCELHLVLIFHLLYPSSG